jgi:hypothetical protein
MTEAAEPHGGLQVGLLDHAPEVARTLIAATLPANATAGTELRVALGVQLTGTTRMGKDLKAAVHCYSRP